MRRNKKDLSRCTIGRNHEPLSSCSGMFREKANCNIIWVSYHDHSWAENVKIYLRLPNVNSFVGKPEAESAVTTADGPGIGMTGIFLSTHNLAWIHLKVNISE